MSDPIKDLRTIIEEKRFRLARFNASKPEVDTSKRWEEINYLDSICKSLENSTRLIPLSVIERMNKGVIEAGLTDFDANCIQVWLPLKDGLNLDNARPCILDLCGFKYTENGIEVRPMDAHDYNSIGFRSGKLYKSLKGMEANHG